MKYIILIAVSVLAVAVNATGGLTAARVPDADVIKLVAQLRPAAESTNGGAFEDFTPVQFKTQVVAGTNYFVKVRTHPTADSYVHLRIYEPLPYTNAAAELTNMQTGKTLGDELEYF